MIFSGASSATSRWPRRRSEVSMSQGPLHSRRAFLALLPVALVALRGGHAWAAAPVLQRKHPTPRRGIDASHVVLAKDLDGNAKAIEAFDLVRQIPEVVDGIRCSCGCDDYE